MLPGLCALFLFFSSLLLFHGCGDDRIGVKLAFSIHSGHRQLSEARALRSAGRFCCGHKVPDMKLREIKR